MNGLELVGALLVVASVSFAIGALVAFGITERDRAVEQEYEPAQLLADVRVRRVPYDQDRERVVYTNTVEYMTPEQATELRDRGKM